MSVQELIEKLQTLPPEKQVVINDADTGWALSIEMVEFDKDTDWVYIGGNYSNVL